MTPQAQAMANVLLEHHRHVCVRTPVPRFNSCLIPYGDLCERAGYAELTQSVGRYLREIAEWCTDNGWPPLNALAVNGATRMPGDNYDLAPGCNILNWPDEAQQCVSFRTYPQRVDLGSA